MHPRRTSPAEPPERRGLAILVAIALLAIVVAIRSQLRAERTQAGGDAPAVELAMLDGERVALASLRGSVVLLDFWATWCPPCVESLPVVAEVGAELASEGVVTVAVSGDQGRSREEIVRRFLKRHGLESLRVALDDGEVAAAFSVTALPTLVVLGRDGRVVATHQGGADEAELRALVARALEAPPRGESS